MTKVLNNDQQLSKICEKREKDLNNPGKNM